MLNFIATDFGLYKIFKIKRVSLFLDTLYTVFRKKTATFVFFVTSIIAD